MGGPTPGAPPHWCAQVPGFVADGVHRCTGRAGTAEACRGSVETAGVPRRTGRPCGRCTWWGRQRQSGVLQRGAAEFSALRSPSGVLGFERS